MPSDDLTAALDELYGAPLAQFVTRRNELAAALKSEGRHDDATLVRALAKPSVSAWAVNQLHFHQPDLMDALATAGAALRHAQAGALSGQGGEPLQEAQAEKRRVIRELEGMVREILVEAGHAASIATLQRIAGTLDALATAKRPDPPPGRLCVDVANDGVDHLAALAASLERAPRRRRPTDRSVEAQSRARAQARAGLTRARRRAETLSERLAELEEDRRAAERRVADARTALEQASEQLEGVVTQSDEVADELRVVRAEAIRLEKVLARLDRDEAPS